MDELTIKVVEVKKIQADVTIGSAKCRTRELLTFFPQVCINKSICVCIIVHSASVQRIRILNVYLKGYF